MQFRGAVYMKKSVMFFLAFCLSVYSLPAFAAFSSNAFDACMEEFVKHLNVLEDTDSAGMSGDEARTGLARAEKKLQNLVNGLSNPREISKARKAANAWIKRGGEEATPLAKAGKIAADLIMKQEKKIAAASPFNAYATADNTAVNKADAFWPMLHQQEIDKAVAQCREIIAPFSSEAGFPDILPKELHGKDWETIRRKVAESCFKCSRIMLELIEKCKFPVKLRLGAMYFRKRFVMGTSIYPNKTESDKIHEFQCRSFADECTLGLNEMRYWKTAEPVWTGDIVWVKNANEGLARVKEMLPTFPAEINADQARDFWRQAADKAIKAGNEAGMTASRVGDVINFPSWRLKFAVKYFKAATKAAVSSNWHARESDPEYWKQAVIKLKKAIEPLSAEIDELLGSLPK